MADEATIKAKIPQAWAVAVVAALTTGVGGGAVAQYRLNALEDRANKIEQVAVQRADDAHKTDLQLQRIEDSLKNLSDDIADLKTQLTRPGRR